MTPFRSRVGRIVVALAVVSACYVGARWLVRSPLDRADGPAGSISVLDAYTSTGDQLVTGFAFDGGGFGLRLCEQRRRGERPTCEVASIMLDGLDPGRLDLREADGSDLRWSPGEVTVIGRRVGGRLVVREVVR